MISKLAIEIKRFWNDEEAATAAEYGIIIAIVGVALTGALTAFRQQIANTLAGANANMAAGVTRGNTP